jgi:diaminopimelate epimerase
LTFLLKAEEITIETNEGIRKARISIASDKEVKIGVGMGKPKFTEEEWQIMKTHPRTGANVISNIPYLSNCVEAVLHHHEWFQR